MSRLRGRVLYKGEPNDSVKSTVRGVNQFMALTEEPEAQKSKRGEGVGGKKEPEAGRDKHYVHPVADFS